MREAFRFSSRMIRTSIPGSKLCASRTRHFSGPRPGKSIQLGKGQAPLHPRCRLPRHVEALHGSTPPGVCS
jgi:hypothetical protein